MTLTRHMSAQPPFSLRPLYVMTSAAAATARSSDSRASVQASFAFILLFQECLQKVGAGVGRQGVRGGRSSSNPTERQQHPAQRRQHAHARTRRAHPVTLAEGRRGAKGSMQRTGASLAEQCGSAGEIARIQVVLVRGEAEDVCSMPLRA